STRRLNFENSCERRSDVVHRDWLVVDSSVNSSSIEDQWHVSVITERSGMGCALRVEHVVRFRNQNQVAPARPVKAKLNVGTNKVARRCGLTMQQFVAGVHPGNMWQCASNIGGKAADFNRVRVVLLDRFVIQIKKTITVSHEPIALAKLGRQGIADGL